MVGLSSQFSGLAHWNIDEAAARHMPLRVTADALKAAVQREQGWPESLREGVTAIADELHVLQDPAQGHSPAVQMSLIVAAISQRTGYTARYALGRPAKDIDKPLRPVHLAALPDAERNAILQTETALDRLAGDFMRLRMTAPESLPR
jgi:hypothetical protein